MIEFPLDQLRTIAKAATRELDYWRDLFDAPSGSHPTMRKGMKDEGGGMRKGCFRLHPSSFLLHPCFSFADARSSPTPARRAQLGALKQQRKLKRDAAERAGRPKRHTPTLEEMLAELQRQSMAGTVPTQMAFNAAKPGHWLTAPEITVALALSWAELAEQAGLKPNPRGLGRRGSAK